MIEVTCGLPWEEAEADAEEAELPSAEKRRVLITLACIRPSTTPRQAEERETPLTTYTPVSYTHLTLPTNREV